MAIVSEPTSSGMNSSRLNSGTLIILAGALGTAGSLRSEYFWRVFLSSQYFSVAWPYSFIGAS